MKCLLGYCLSHRCSNFPMWDDEKKKMVCNAYHDGIPDSMWHRVEAGKNCLYLNKDRITMDFSKIRKKMEQIDKMNLSDEDYIKALNKFDIIIYRTKTMDEEIDDRIKEFDKWFKETFKRD